MDKSSLTDEIRLIILSNQASSLILRIIDEEIPKERVPTQNDVEFQNVVNQIYLSSPLLADSYKVMYNYIQKQKTPPGIDYLKRLLINEESIKYDSKSNSENNESKKEL
jgi:hypothetical protein